MSPVSGVALVFVEIYLSTPFLDKNMFCGGFRHFLELAVCKMLSKGFGFNIR